jgi:four helix bundle protein
MKNNRTKAGELETRTKAFALRIIRLYSSLPPSVPAQVIGRQVLRSGTSVGAQYREGMRARSRAEFLSKLTSALQELEETSYWLELFIESSILPPHLLSDLCTEADQLTALLVASINTAKSRAS